MIGRRHSAWVRRRIAEIIIPAWLIPIQKTKLTMKKPHIAGRFSPVTPTPLLSIQPNAADAGQEHEGEERDEPQPPLRHSQDARQKVPVDLLLR